MIASMVRTGNPGSSGFVPSRVEWRDSLQQLNRSPTGLEKDSTLSLQVLGHQVAPEYVLFGLPSPYY
jgi:hypothetical protein